MRIISFLLSIIVFALLTALTQIGGLIFLVSFATHTLINRKFDNIIVRFLLKFISFLSFYLVTTFVVVPFIAKPFGRVALPITETDNLKPLNFITCFLNRNYVKAELKEVTLDVARKLNDKFPGSVVNYLDAGFPFLDNFPLIPHLSHNDGKKLDVAFFYINKKGGKQTNEVPSVIGYGVSEGPKVNEVNTANLCKSQGHWQYSFMTKVIPQGRKAEYIFDSSRTRELVNLFASKPSVGKIFIEPHLKTRLKLTNSKIRFHGCQAVRHDDHIHVQLN